MKRSPWRQASLCEGLIGSLWSSLALFSALLILSFFLFDQQIQQLITHLNLSSTTSEPFQKLLLAFLLIALLALDVILPVPSSMVALLAVASFGGLGGYLLVFTGLCLGANLGYWLGAGYFRLLSNWLSIKEWQQAGRLGKQLSTISLICLRGVPVLAEASVLAAGMQHFPPKKFLLVTSLANAGVALVYSALGSFIQEDDVLFLAVIAAIVLPIIFMGGAHLLKILKLSYQKQATRYSSELLEGRFEISYYYPIVFTEHIFDPVNPCLYQQLAQPLVESPIKILSFIDTGLLQSAPELKYQIYLYFNSHASTLHLLADPIPVPAGELSKTPEVLQQLYAQMLDHGLDRHCYVLAIGGGAVLDAVGYACATFHRGVRLIRIPTTVLAQNDAGIGVKNGINAFGYKNLLGAFYPANAVINDFQLLSSLPRRDQIAGLAEAVKVAVIKDQVFFQWLEQHADALAAFEHEASRYAIRRCAELHLEHITRTGGDPFERGNGRPLDYGHWAAHKLESLGQHRLRHGEAVAVGMALDAVYSSLSGLLPKADAERLLRLLLKLGFCLSPPELSLRDPQGGLQVLQGLEDFRQHLGGQLSIPMLHQIGTSVSVHHIERSLMEQALLQLSMNAASDFSLLTEQYAK
ncbi:3-dehydroquinate synthase [Azomonas agilis]|uniref:3-dehydroquinate synthase n=1 Tax=Azomonas agilis TaxID=116849 RepID=A0A562IYA9_9GAMM|nr:3-dehydroquinate synthase [Azomonas agilis]TWH75989.1 3-dehydroquinate synthase [Azomonas agilis]